MARRGPPPSAAAYWTGSEKYVADRIVAELKPLIGDIKTDVIVDTTIDANLQGIAEKAVERQIDDWRKAFRQPRRAGVDRHNRSRQSLCRRR